QAGTTVVLSVEATGTAPLSYLWYRNVTNTLSDGFEVTGSASNLLTLASVQAYGTAPQYQWYKDGGPVNGGTLAVLTLAGVTEGDVGGYSVVVSNAYG